MLSSAIFSLRLIGNKRVPRYMSYFYVYSLIGGIMHTLDYFRDYFKILDKIAWGIISNSLLLFHFTFLSFFIYSVLSNKNVFKLMTILFYIFLAIILFCFLTNDLSTPISTAFAFTNFGLVIFCCFYYVQLFNAVPTIHLLKDAAFWVVNGIFFVCVAQYQYLL